MGSLFLWDLIFCWAQWEPLAQAAPSQEGLQAPAVPRRILLPDRALQPGLGWSCWTYYGKEQDSCCVAEPQEELQRVRLSEQELSLSCVSKSRGMNPTDSPDPKQ